MARVIAAICFLVSASYTSSGFGQSIPTAPPESVGLSSKRLARIGEVMEREVSEGRMPGAVLAVARHGKLVLYESFGYLDVEAGTPMPKDAIFRIASLTKPIVAVAALTLYERGELLLHEPISTYLPELAEKRVAVDYDPSRTVSARRQPTVQDLFRHTDGFAVAFTGSTALHRLYPSGDWSRRLSGSEFLAELAALPLHHQPGTTWDYGHGFNLLGLMIERISGKAHGEFLRDAVFDPLDMKDTSFAISSDKASRLAKPLPNDPVTGAPTRPRDPAPLKVECGGGCLLSTAFDYLVFAQMLLNGGVLNGERILGVRTVEYMTADHADPEIDLSRLHYYASMPDDGYGFGLGVAVRRGAGLGGTMGSPGEFHWYGASGTFFRVDPREGLVIVFMAQTPGPIRRINRQLVPALVYQAITE